MKAEGLVYDLPREVNFFLENRCKKIHGEKSGIYQNYYFLCLIPIWQSLSFGVNILILQRQSKTKEIARHNLPLSVRDKFNFQIVSSSAVYVLTACTSWISLEPKTQFLRILRDSL